MYNYLFSLNGFSVYWAKATLTFNFFPVKMITRYKQLKHWIGITAYLFPLFKFSKSVSTLMVDIIAPSGFMASGQKLEEASEEFLRVFIWIGIENNNNNNNNNNNDNDNLIIIMG